MVEGAKVDRSIRLFNDASISKTIYASNLAYNTQSRPIQNGQVWYV